MESPIGKLHVNDRDDVIRTFHTSMEPRERIYANANRESIFNVDGYEAEKSSTLVNVLDVE